MQPMNNLTDSTAFAAKCSKQKVYKCLKTSNLYVYKGKACSNIWNLVKMTQVAFLVLNC